MTQMTIDVVPLGDRIQEVAKFRKRHEELRAVILRILPPTSSAAGEIDTAFSQMGGLDLLDLSAGACFPCL